MFRQLQDFIFQTAGAASLRLLVAGLPDSLLSDSLYYFRIPHENMKKNAEHKAFKDWFDRKAARAMAAQVAAAAPDFDESGFVRKATRSLNKLEFNARVQQFSDALRATLPESIPHALATLSSSLPEELPDCEAVADGWLQLPLGQFIADHGLDHFDESMTAMIALTKRMSSEFAVRPFVEHHQDVTFERLFVLTSDPNPHVRRWCSEAVRPRLPWGRKLRALVADPGPIWPILEALKDDDELYVRRSVANNLNDIAKDHPQLVVKRCKQWKKGGNEHRSWVVRHGLRSLIKDGHPGALAVVGFGPPKKLTAELTIRPKQIAVGGQIELTARIETTAGKAQELIVDYAVNYVRKSGKSSSKVFKWTTTRLPANGSVTLDKRHAMKLTTIRALYPGVHHVELQVNGVRMAEASFRLG